MHQGCRARFLQRELLKTLVVADEANRCACNRRSSSINKGDNVRTISKLVALAILGANALSVTAQTATWPNRPVCLIVSYAAGGSADSLARYVALKLSNRDE